MLTALNFVNPFKIVARSGVGGGEPRPQLLLRLLLLLCLPLLCLPACMYQRERNTLLATYLMLVVGVSAEWTRTDPLYCFVGTMYGGMGRGVGRGFSASVLACE